SVEELCDHIALINKSKKILDGNVKDIRRKFKTNTYEFELANLQGDLKSIMDGKFQLIENINEDQIAKVKIKTSSDISQNDLLQAVMPFAQVNSFRELIPSMNDIFISQVEKDSQNIN
ncbi:MAG: DUF4162 domain-containing protein, partial [Bacteroidales bacterium]